MNLLLLVNLISFAEAAFIATSPELSPSNRITTSSLSTTQLTGVRQALKSAIGSKKKSVEKRNYSGFGNAYTVKGDTGQAGGSYLDTLGTPQKKTPPVFSGFTNRVPSISKTVPAAKSILRSAKETAKTISSPVTNSVRVTACSLWDRLKRKRSKGFDDVDDCNQQSLTQNLKQTQDLELEVAQAVLKEAKEKTKLIRENLQKKQYAAKSNVEQLMVDLEKQEDEFRNFRSKATSLSNDFDDYKSSNHEERASLERRIEQQDSALDALLRDAKELCEELDSMLPL